MAGENSTLDDIASVIGFTPTLRLAAWYGNTNNLYVPEIVTDDQVLVRLLGRAAAERLAKAFPNEHIAVPRMTAYEEEERRCRIARLLQRGFSMREVAKFERISERRVQQICRELEQAGAIKPVGPEETEDEMPIGMVLLEKPSGKSPSEKPSGKSPSEKPSGKSPSEKPSGKSPSEKPSGKSPSEKPSGKSPSEKPSGKSPWKKPVAKGPWEKPLERTEAKRLVEATRAGGTCPVPDVPHPVIHNLGRTDD